MSESEKRRHVGRRVDRSVRIAAEPHDVYESWADPERLALWFVDRAEGRATTGALMTWIFETFNYRFPVPIVEARQDEKIVIAGEVPGRLPFMQEIIVTPEGGKTTLRVINSGFGEAPEHTPEFDGVDSGWVMAMNTLKRLLECHPTARRRTQHLAMAPAKFEHLRDFRREFFDVAAIRRWSGATIRASADTLAPGVRIALASEDGTSLEGEVLAASDFEVLLSWPEQEGVLAMKVILGGPVGRCVALHYNSWSTDEEGARRPIRQIDELARRLAATKA